MFFADIWLVQVVSRISCYVLKHFFPECNLNRFGFLHLTNPVDIYPIERLTFDALLLYPPGLFIQIQTLGVSPDDAYVFHSILIPDLANANDIFSVLMLQPSKLLNP